MNAVFPYISLKFGQFEWIRHAHGRGSSRGLESTGLRETYSSDVGRLSVPTSLPFPALFHETEQITTIDAGKRAALTQVDFVRSVGIALPSLQLQLPREGGIRFFCLVNGNGEGVPPELPRY